MDELMAKYHATIPSTTQQALDATGLSTAYTMEEDSVEPDYIVACLRWSDIHGTILANPCGIFDRNTIDPRFDLSDEASLRNFALEYCPTVHQNGFIDLTFSLSVYPLDELYRCTLVEDQIQMRTYEDGDYFLIEKPGLNFRSLCVFVLNGKVFFIYTNRFLQETPFLTIMKQ